MEQIPALAIQVQALTSLVQNLSNRLLVQENLQVSAPKSLPVTPGSAPDFFYGDRKKFFLFREGCKMYFALRPRSSGTEAQKVGLVMSLLREEPQTWAFSLSPDSPLRSSLDTFFVALGQIYDEPDRPALAVSRLLSLRQGKQWAEDYCATFRQYVTDSGWNDLALKDLFLTGLSDSVKDLLIAYTEPKTLDEAMTLAVRADRRLRSRRSPRLSHDPQPISNPVSSLSRPEPMELGSITPEQRREHRLRNRLCFYCGSPQHLRSACPKLSQQENFRS